MLLRRLCRRCALGWLCPLDSGWVHGLRLAWVRLPGLVPLRRLWPPVRFGVGCALWVLAGCMACDLRWRVCPAGCCCGGSAAGARLGGCASRCFCGAAGWALRLVGRACPANATASALHLARARISNHQPRPSSRRSRLPVISRRRACPTACCCGAGCPGYGSRRTGVSCWRDGLGPVSFTDVPCPITGPRVGLFLNWMFALRYALWLNTLAACRAALTPLSSRRGRRRREMRRLSRANNAA